MCLFWLVRSLGVRIFELRFFGVRYFGWSLFSGCSDLWASLLGGSEFWVYCILASWVFGFNTLGSSDLRLSVWMFAAGRMVLLVFLGSHGTLVAVSTPLMMPLRDSDIPMNVPFTFSNKQALNPGSGMRGRLGWCGVRWLFQGCCAGLRLKHGTAAAWRAGTLRKGS
jgi:hypothetical protein